MGRGGGDDALTTARPSAANCTPGPSLPAWHPIIAACTVNQATSTQRLLTSSVLGGRGAIWAEGTGGSKARLARTCTLMRSSASRVLVFFMLLTTQHRWGRGGGRWRVPCGAGVSTLLAPATHRNTRSMHSVWLAPHLQCAACACPCSSRTPPARARGCCLDGEGGAVRRAKGRHEAVQNPENVGPGWGQAARCELLDALQPLPLDTSPTKSSCPVFSILSSMGNESPTLMHEPEPCAPCYPPTQRHPTLSCRPIPPIPNAHSSSSSTPSSWPVSKHQQRATLRMV